MVEKNYYPEYFKLYVSSKMYLSNKVDDNLIAFGRVTINNLIVIENVRVMQGPHGLFVSMPQYLNRRKDYQSYVGFENVEIYQRIQQQVLWDVAYLQAAKESPFIEVKVMPVKSGENGRLLGLATIILEGITIRKVRIYEGICGKVVTMPQHNGKDMIHPANAQLRYYIQRAVIEEYERVCQ